MKKHNKSLRDCIKRLKGKKSNIVGCDDRIASFAFKKGLLTEYELYLRVDYGSQSNLRKCLHQSGRYELWDYYQIVVKNFAKQAASHPMRQDRRMTYPTLGIMSGSVSRSLKAALHLVKATLNLRFLLIKSRPRLRRPTPDSPLEPVTNSVSHLTYGRCRTHFTKVLFFINLNMKGLRLLLKFPQNLPVSGTFSSFTLHANKCQNSPTFSTHKVKECTIVKSIQMGFTPSTQTQNEQAEQLKIKFIIRGRGK
ncbi:hypothetical protein L3X38_026274 [Prunus dulcis]|uniref:Uncharacterized protein n=1 Tax=Prunus dulcis TaxID=3755 RepID=A0AAD4UP34_PRUDU|nr:hypothetical protein L3X38_026274 [Prunus dulcis]